jgi:hypothetical protein
LTSASEADRRRFAAIEGLCRLIWTKRPSARCFAYMRVRGSGRTRELILGSESLVADDVPLLDWQHAPLASVFLLHERDDDYELELDDGRVSAGTVLDWAVVQARDDRSGLASIDDGEQRLIAEPDDLHTEPSRLRDRLPLREPSLRNQPRASQILVELDPVQRAAVELPESRCLLILGDAGFGKTTVALHRLAHLRALVLVPTRGLARLVVALLDRLGVDDVEVRSFPRWVAAVGRKVFPDLPARDSKDAPLAVSRVKRHPALRTVLPEIIRKTAAMREVEAGYREHEAITTAEQLLHLFGDRALLDRVAALSDGQLTPRMLEQVVAHTRVLFSPTTEHAHPDIDAERLATVDGRAIDEGTPMQDAETIDSEDFAVLLELQHLRGEQPPTLPRYDHIVVDEAQEFAAIELAVIGRALAPTGSLSIAGDEQQQVDETIVFTSWPQVVAELAVADRCEHVALQISYRCPPAVEALARRLFASEGAGSRAGEPSQADPTVTLTATAHELELVTILIRALTQLRSSDRSASVAVVCRFAGAARRLHDLLAPAVSCRLVVDGDFRFGAGISVTCIDEIKGLEFDYVIVADAGAASYPADDEARRALYVAVTRTRARLWLLWSGRASPLLR